jgi:uncharacterized membrane protein YuzA (DUF378 family)
MCTSQTRILYIIIYFISLINIFIYSATRAEPKLSRKRNK